MMKTGLLSAGFVIFVSVCHMTDGYSSYIPKIPNGKYVTSPCPGPQNWPEVGHYKHMRTSAVSTAGRFLNAFGEDFKNAGRVFTPALCYADSDGDGVPNWQELGLNLTRVDLCSSKNYIDTILDPKHRQFLIKNLYLSPVSMGHPGICESSRATCKHQNLRADVVCPTASTP